MGQTPFGNNFGTVAFKTEILEHRPGAPGGFLRLLPEQHIRNTLRCLCSIFPDDVAVETFGGVYTCVAQLHGYGDDICAICRKDRGHGMPERMGIDMRQIMAAGKVIEPSGDAVIVRREYKSGVLLFLFVRFPVIIRIQKGRERAESSAFAIYRGPLCAAMMTDTGISPPPDPSFFCQRSQGFAAPYAASTDGSSILQRRI